MPTLVMQGSTTHFNKLCLINNYFDSQTFSYLDEKATSFVVFFCSLAVCNVATAGRAGGISY
jgi:hypothetical protein